MTAFEAIHMSTMLFVGDLDHQSRPRLQLLKKETVDGGAPHSKRLIVWCTMEQQAPTQEEHILTKTASCANFATGLITKPSVGLPSPQS